MQPATASHKRVTSFSGNEIFCLEQIGYRPGRICFGNSVMSLGVARGVGATLSNLAGGEVTEVTDLIHEARERAYERMMKEAETFGGNGVASVNFDIINHAGQIEFIAVGSTVHHPDEEGIQFSTPASGQDFYCQIDAGFSPKDFVFGNIAYSIGVGGNLKGSFSRLQRGEVPQFTKIFDHTRHTALERIKQEAKAKKANAVIGIITSISPFMGTQEMMMLGTAADHPALQEYYDDPVTSNLTGQELWNMVNLGYMPIQLVMGVSVYSLGLASGVRSLFKSLGRGEIETTTALLHEARDKALERVHEAALACQADEVIGVKTRIYNLGGGLIECMVMGTAVKKIASVTTRSKHLLPQALTTDQDTFFDSAVGTNVGLNKTQAASARITQGQIRSMIITIIFVLIYVFFNFLH